MDRKYYGQCFLQKSSGGYYKKNECNEKCELTECPCCYTELPECILDSFNGYCTCCFSENHGTKKCDHYIYENLEKKYTICGNKLKSFKVTNDWGSRKMHKKCWFNSSFND